MAKEEKPKWEMAKWEKAKREYTSWLGALWCASAIACLKNEGLQ
jgi:hypothetical protein